MESYAHRGSSPSDRPTVDDVLEAIDRAATLGADSTPEERAAAADLAAREVEAGTDAVAAGVDTAEADDAPATGAASADADDGSGADTDSRPATSTPEPPERAPSADADDGVVLKEAPPEGGSLPPTDDGAEVMREGEETEPEPEPLPRPERPLAVPETADLPEGIELRRGERDDALDAMRVLQGALLDIDTRTVREASTAGELLLAEDDGWVVGALVLQEGHIESMAVRREYRGQGIGSALVAAAVADEDGIVTADFRAGVRGFWEEAGFTVTRDDGRFWGVREG